MKPLLFSPRKVFIATITAIVTLTILGWGFWSLAAAQYRHIIDGWIEEGRNAGYQITYDDRQVFGFPRRITMRLVNLHWKNTDGIDFRTEDMDIVVTPWDWNLFDVKFKNHVSVAAPLDSDGHALMLSSGGGRAHIRLDNDGIWREAKLSLEEASLGLAPNYLFQSDKLSASVIRPDIPPKDHTEAGLTLEGEADDVTLPSAMPSPFGNKAAKLVTHMRVMGRVPDVRKRAVVDAWNKDSGIVEFDDFSIKWGVLDMDSKGTLGFDDDLQPEGAFAGTVANPEKTMRSLIDKGFIAMHDETMLASLMEMFSKPLPHGSKGLELPITVQLGGLFLGPVRIFTFPEIEWPTEPPATTN
jgi:Uncharacterized protein conserved in bacteria (DUF2125)